MRKFTLLILLIFSLCSGCGYSPDVQPSYATSIVSVAPSYPNTLLSTPTYNIVVPPTNTIVALPTFNEQEKEDYIFSQLVNNGGCDLPCWWGITPGKSLWSDVGAFFSVLGFRSSQIPGTSEFYMGGVHLFSIKTSSSVIFRVESNAIQSIDVSIDGSLEPRKFQNAYNYYSPDEILIKYGQPSRILFEIPAYGYGDRVAYDYSLIYDHLGFLVLYSGVAEFSDPVYVCPSFVYDSLISGMRLYLQEPGDNLSLGVLGRSHTMVKTFEEATGKSVSEYYNEFEVNPADICFTTPGSLWR